MFKNPEDYDGLNLGDQLVIENAPAQIEQEELVVKNKTTGKEYVMLPGLSELEKTMILAGGKINMIKSQE